MTDTCRGLVVSKGFTPLTISINLIGLSSVSKVGIFIYSPSTLWDRIKAMFYEIICVLLNIPLYSVHTCITKCHWREHVLMFILAPTLIGWSIYAPVPKLGIADSSGVASMIWLLTYCTIMTIIHLCVNVVHVRMGYGRLHDIIYKTQTSCATGHCDWCMSTCNCKVNGIQNNKKTLVCSFILIMQIKI